MRPGWVTPVAVLGIVFGCFGILGASQTLLMPLVLPMEQQMLSAIQTQPPGHQGSDALSQAGAGFLNKWLRGIPSWFTAWSVGLGAINMIIAGVYVFGAIWLLLMRPLGLRIFAIGLAASIAVTFVRMAGLTAALGFFGLAMSTGSMLGVIIDAVLLVVILAHRREWQVAVEHHGNSIANQKVTHDT